MSNNELSAYTLPTFSGELASSPDGEFVSMLSSPSIPSTPSCTSKGSGDEIGKAFSCKIAADVDDGWWDYQNDFGIDEVAFGSITPAV